VPPTAPPSGGTFSDNLLPIARRSAVSAAALLQVSGFPFTPVAPAAAAVFGSSPSFVRGYSVRTGTSPAQVQPVAITVAFFIDPQLRKAKPAIPDQPGVITVTVAVATPAAWGMFSESPTRIMPPRALYPWADISFLQIVYTPSAWGMFSESPYALVRPRPFEQQPFEFVSGPAPGFWGMFSESPYQIRRPTPLYPWSDISFLQITYTPSALVFSESPYQLKGPRPFEQQPFEVYPISVPTPQAWGMFSESPWWLRRPFQLNAFADISFLQIAYTPSTWGMFAESPYQLKAPRPEIIPWVGRSPVPPAALAPLVFSESPWQFKRPFQLQQFADISFLQIVYTPSNWGQFSESPYRIKAPLSPQLMQAADISFLQIAYTPSGFGFSEHPLANRYVHGWKAALDQPGIAPKVPPAATQTPTTLVFSEPQRHITMRWIGAAQLDLGNWGWATPPAVVIKNVWEWHIRYRRRGRR
jgi:hypothetical protein